MDRRAFLQTSLLCGSLGIAAPLRALVPRVSGRAPRVRWQIFENGAFSVVSDQVLLDRCYPAIDGRSVVPSDVRIKRQAGGGRISYVLDEGVLQLDLREGPSGLAVATTLTGFRTAPHWVCPVAQAATSGADRFFKQGLGFAGPSGLFPLKKGGVKPWDVPMLEEAWSYDSYMTAALVYPGSGTLAIGALQHSDFVHRSTVYNRTHRRGLNDYSASDEVNLFESGFATERISLGGRSLTLPALHLLHEPDAYTALHTLAVQIAHASGARTHLAPRFQFCSWLEYFEDYDLERLQDLLGGLKTLGPRLPMQTIQIDGGYTFAGDWLEVDERLYPGGLRHAFARIKETGYEAGIWVAPYIVSDQSRLFKEHPEWILKGKNGKPLLNSEGKPFLDSLSAYDRRFYLDTSHPDAFAYLRDVFRTLKSWGCTYFKTDFMDWGLRDSTEVARHVPGKTSAQYYADLMRMIRAEIGENSFWLGCIAPFGQMLGFADGMRVANDAGTGWNAGSTLNMIQESHADQYFNNVLWQNDPDILTFRSSTQVKLTDEEVLSLALWSAISGGAISISDRVHRLLDYRLRWLRFIAPHPRHKLTARLPFWEAGRDTIVAVRTYEGRDAWAVLVFNTTDQEASPRYALRELVGTDSAFCFAWTPGQLTPLGRRTQLEQRLKPHHSALYYVSRSEKAPDNRLGLNGEVIPGL